jgi:hypothetical protein
MTAPDNSSNEPVEERWAPVQVASFLGMSYQDARNAMLEGSFGESHYDAASRRLTVLASRVREFRTTRRKSPKKPAKRSRNIRKR